MIEHLPALIIVTPLLVALIVSMAGWLRPSLCFPFAVFALVVSALSAVGLTIQAATSGPVDYFLGNWRPPVGIAYHIDTLSGMVSSAVAISALLNLWSSRRLIREDYRSRLGAFYTLYLLSVTGLIGIVVTGDAFNLYVLLEIASLTGYSLIGMGPGRAALSSFNYVIMGTIGACFYLLGVGYLYIATGTLNMADLARILPSLADSRTVLVAFCLAMVGMWMKMALFPLHGWLPAAYTDAPSPAAGLMAPLVTKVMIYVMIRLMISVFGLKFAYDALMIKNVVVWLAIIAIGAGAFLALAERNFKRMLTYIIVAEVGYMVGGAWLGNRLGLTGSILHILNDAFMTLCVFLAAANIHYKLRDFNFSNLGELFAKMPFTMGALVVGALSIIGVPPTCGFFSKWYLLRGAVEAGNYFFVAALLFSSLVAVVLFFRVFEIGFFQLNADHGHGGHHHGPAMAEAPADMVIPLMVSAAVLIVLGLYSGPLVTYLVGPAIPLGTM